jgi:hypothetical protein
VLKQNLAAKRKQNLKLKQQKKNNKKINFFKPLLS